jgi:hypothetical protein
MRLCEAWSTSSFPGLLASCFLDNQSLLGGEAGPRGCASPNFRPEVWLQPRIRRANTSPSFFSRVKLQSDRRVLRDLFQPGATQLGFSTLNSTFVLVKNQGLERFCLKRSTSFRNTSCEISVYRRSSAGISGEPALSDTRSVGEWVLRLAGTPDESADLFSRRVVGWAMAASADETLVEGALRMALSQRRPQAG